ncbi:MAG: hypothetical protein Kow0077_06630 [Anaerolineae bacterium]
MFGTLTTANAQGDALPPHVIDVWPLPGVELSGSEPLAITFDQPMMRDRVEEAVALEPSVALAFDWADDRTLHIRPAEDWPRASTFELQIGQSATAVNGLPLEETYRARLKTIGALEVTSVVPAEGAEGVAVDARILVTFNRPVVPLVSTEQLQDLPSPLVVEPEVEGTGEWLNTSIYQFAPSEALQGGTTYTVTVPGGLTAVTGAVLEADYQWRFRTLVPQILNIQPYPNERNVLLDRQITVQFSQPMDHVSTEAAFSLLANGEPVDGVFTWDASSTVLTFTPARMLQIETVYLLNITTQARSASGEAMLESGQSLSFSTVPYPGIEETYPRNGDRGVRPGRGASITFRSPMNTETFEGRVRISPETAWTPYVSGNRSLQINFAARPNTTYQITFLAGAEDIYGNAIPTDYTFTFTTTDIPTWAYPYSARSNLAITGAYRQDTRFPIYVSGTPTVHFELYHLELEDLAQAIRYYYRNDETPPWLQRGNRIRTWSQTFDSEGVEGVAREVLLASDEGGTLPLGVYWVKMAAPDRNQYQFPIVVGSANLTLKSAPEDLMVWVTDMATAEPLAGVTVMLYDGDRLVARGRTGDDGVFRVPSNTVDRQNLIAVVDDQDAFGVWFAPYGGRLPDRSVYLHTDRPIYRPGQTVYFRGVLRDRHDMDYRIPNLRSVEVTIEELYSGQQLFTGSLPVTDFGTFSGELVLPEDAPLGTGYIRVGNDGIQFTIAEFRVPEYEVTVTPQQQFIMQGDSLNVLAQSSYYFGGGVSNARVSWNALGQPVEFVYTGPGRYHFGDETQEFFYQEYLGEGAGTTDSEGKFLFTLDRTHAPSKRPMRISVETTVVDESQQAISGRATVIAHPANVYVGVRSDRYFGREGQPMQFDLVAVDAESVPLEDKAIDLEFVEIRWSRIPIEGEFGRYRWEQETIVVATDRVRTGADGTASYTFSPPNAGIFRVRATALDEKERQNGSTLRFWVTGNRPVWWGEPSRTIDLIADKESYAPGETAQILVPIPFAGASTVLVSMERAGVMAYEVLQVEGSTLLYELPISEDFVPSVHVDVTVIKGIDEESLNPDYRTGQIALQVEPKAYAIEVAVTPSATLLQPQDTVTFDVVTRAANGEPVQTEVGLALTDKAILALAPPNSGPILEAFYGDQPNYVSTNNSLDGLLDRISDEALGVEAEMAMRDAAAPAEEGMVFAAMPTATMADAAGGGAGDVSQVPVREEFEQTPLWEAHVVTGTDGRASVSVKLPDNLTTWVLDARAISRETLVGEGGTEIMVTLPLLIRPVAPRFLVVDDRVELAAVVNNNTDQTQQVQVTLQAEGVEMEDPATQVVTIDAGARARVTWWAVARDVPYVDLTFIALGEDGYQDAVKPALATGPDNTIPVYRYTAPDTVGTAGVLRDAGARTEAISLPPRLDVTQGELVVKIDPSLAATITDSFDYLRNYPHQCIEQTVSRFLPNVVTFRALQALNFQDPALEANLFTVLDEGLTILKNAQNADGGWGWFTRMESSPLVTAYAALGLIEAREAGFDIDPTMIDRALNFVRGDFVRPRMETPAWRLNRQAFYFYVFARAGKGGLEDFLALHDQRLELSVQGRAYLLMAFQAQYPDHPAIDDLVSDLTTSAILSATGAHWEEATNDWWNWSSDTKTTALALAALTRTEPQSDLLPNVVRWLMVARQGDHWSTTQENVWAVIALTDWMVNTGELNGSYAYGVTLNDDLLTRGEVTPATVRDGEVLRVAVQDLLTAELNRLTVSRGEGTGALYYTAHMNLRLPAAEVDAISRGITVTREYFRADDPEKPVASARVGDVVTVRLTINLPEDVYYFVLEDPIPAGTEGVDTSLLTTSQQAAGPQVRPVRDYDPYWYWGWWLFDRTEMRDEQVNLYADFLPRGTYVYTYEVRASMAGEFQTMPAHAYAFYFPELFGRTAGTLFTIEGEAG